MKVLTQSEINCPLCSSDQKKFLFSDYNRRDGIDCKGTYVQCSVCSLIYLSNPPPWQDMVKYYSAVEPEWTANSGMQDPQTVLSGASKKVPLWKVWLRKFRFRPHSWPLKIVQAGSKRILDLGCGNGAKLVEFSQRGYDIWGVDVGIDAINLCEKILPEGHFLRGELQDTKLPGDYFHYIRIDNALEHVPNPKDVIRECLRLLLPGGQLMIYVPHGKSLSMRLMKGSSISSWIPFHLQLFTKWSLKRMLEEIGFKNINIYGYSPPSWLPMSIVQMQSGSKKTMKINFPSWLNIVCYSIAWLMSKVGMAEELVVKCQKGI